MPSVEVYNPDYKMSYPGPEAYHGQKEGSPDALAQGGIPST
jgi:hypothetical protein